MVVNGEVCFEVQEEVGVRSFALGTPQNVGPVVG